MTLRTGVAALGMVVLLVGCGAAHPTTTTAVVSQRVAYEGVVLTVPPAWPVIDGAHRNFPCRGPFAGQEDRVFIGDSLLGAPSCPMMVGTPPPADGVWIVGRGFAPSSSAQPQTLPSGQVVYVDQGPQRAVVVWVNGISIQIGVGPDPRVEQSILNSIRSSRGVPNTPLLGACARPTGHAGPMPTPIRVTTPVRLPYGAGTIQPARADRTPKVAAFHLWHNLQQNYKAPFFPSNLDWHIYFGVRPGALGTPIWLILGRGTPTKYGPCGNTILASYDATTGTSLGLETVG